MRQLSIFIPLIVFSAVTCLFAQNPISPPGVYLADPSAKVWQDGKLYVYGSLDVSCNFYCSHRHHVLSTDDMRKWEVHEDVFFSKGEKDEVPGSDALLFAPDAQYKDGRYYLYYCMPDRNYSEGVAVSDSPTGPFTDGQKIDLGGYNQIDPSAFVDDDGETYYLWGQFTLKMAKLKPNMKELDLSTVQDSILTEGEHFFHEGAYLTKRDGLYYLIYADMSRANKPTCIGYATSKSPFGPYTYGGVIVDNRHCNPNNWNNHGSIAQLNDQWYVFYHRSTHACNKMRKACVEPISFNADGSIPEVEMTTQGALPPLPATQQLDAERACLLLGNVRVVQEGDNNEILSQFSNGDKIAYKYLDFSQPVKSVTVRLKAGKDGGSLVVKSDMPWHATLASIQVEGEANGEWKETVVDLENIPSGTKALWLQTWGGEDILELDWLRFD